MNVCVLGLWHLGTVTCGCLAQAGHQVVGVDADAVVQPLQAGRLPVAEPGLEQLVRDATVSGRLRFTSDARQAVAASDVIWIAFDTPVDAEDRADVEYVLDRVRVCWDAMRGDATVVVSSQVPVGTTRALQRECEAARPNASIAFACIPENLRLGDAIRTFSRADRLIVGTDREAVRDRLSGLLSSFTNRIEWMRIESAEMTKHALNAFLATSVVFANEVATLCERVGADAREVERGLRSEARIGMQAYLTPGAAFAGGTLARDLVFLQTLGRESQFTPILLNAVRASNDAHKQWTARQLNAALGSVIDRRIAVWGLAYKPGTDTLRRSSSVELCHWLIEQGAQVSAHDPAVRKLPDTLSAHVSLASDGTGALEGADALVVATAWPEYREIDAADVYARMRQPLVIDPGGVVSATLGADARFRYVALGRPFNVHAAGRS